SPREDTRLLDSGNHGRAFEDELRHPVQIALQPIDLLQKAGLPHRVDPEADAPRDDEAPPESVPRDFKQDVQEVTAQAAEPGSPGEIAGVAAEGAEVAHVIGDSLQLERDAANRLRGEGRVRAAQA